MYLLDIHYEGSGIVKWLGTWTGTNTQFLLVALPLSCSVTLSKLPPFSIGDGLGKTEACFSVCEIGSMILTSIVKHFEI